MKNNNTIFILRFYDNEVSPESFSAKELGQLLINIEESIKSIVESKFPEGDPEEVKISLIDIENKSESLKFAINGEKTTSDAFVYWGKSIKENTYTDLPDKAYCGFKYVYSLMEKKKCRSELIYKNEQIYDLSYDYKLVKQENVLVKSDLSIYGELIKIGGEHSKAWFELTDGQKIDFSITKEQAEELSPSIYKTIGLKGNAKWNVKTHHIVSFKLYDVLTYKPGNISKGLEKIRNISSGFWDNLNDNEINNYLLRD